MTSRAPAQSSAGRSLVSRPISRETGHLISIVAPGVAWIVLFLLLPSVLLIGIAFMTNGTYGLPQMPLSLESFKQLAGFGVLGWRPGTLDTLLRSVWQTVIATGLIGVISYPVAYYITTRPAHLRPLLLLAVVVPSWTNQVIRAVGWMNILAPGTPVSNLASELGLIAPQMGLFPSRFAVVIGLVYNFLPFMVLPLYASFERLDYRQVEAARDLGAGALRVFLHTIMPQTLPGLMAGTVLVSIPAFGMYVIPELLGGGKAMMMGNFVAQQFAGASNWPLGAAAAIIMMLATLAGLQLMRHIARRLGGGVDVLL